MAAIQEVAYECQDAADNGQWREATGKVKHFLKITFYIFVKFRTNSDVTGI